MPTVSRRHVLASAGAVSAFRPHRAKAGTTITAWWSQGYYKAEDDALRAAVAAYEKQSGNKVELSMVTQSDLTTKIIAAMAVGDVPDVVQAVGGNNLVMPQAAWDDKLIDCGDVVATQKAEFIPSALESVSGYNNVTKKRFYYGVPLKGPRRAGAGAPVS